MVEFLDRIVPGMDAEIAKNFQRVLKKQGMTFRLSSKVTGAEAGKTGVALTLEPAKGGAAETLEADVVLVAIGRRPHTEGLGLERAGVGLDEAGRITVDGRFQTNIAGVYAIGDVIAGPMLAHKAEEEGVALAEILAGQSGHVNYETVPGIVYTWPEVAAVGKTEDDLKQAGVDYQIGKFPFIANSRARCTGDTEGFVNILSDATTDRILGAHILGPESGKDVGNIRAALSEMDAGEVAAAVDRGESLDVAGFELAPDEILVTAVEQEGFASAQEDGYVVVVDTELSPELLDEGLAREIVHRIQNMRRDAEFDISDRITTYWQGDDDVRRVMAAHGEYISSETLSLSLEEADPPADAHREDSAIDGHTVSFGVRKAT